MVFYYPNTAQLLNCVKKAVRVIFFLSKSRSFAKQSYMKKFSLIITFLLAVLILQSCKKDTIIAYATSSNTLFAVINDTTWSASDISASLTYNAAAKTKVFTCTGIGSSKKVAFTITATGQSNTASFPLQTFLSDGAGTNFAYYTATNSGDYVQ